jgi:hypothetical protein
MCLTLAGFIVAGLLGTMKEEALRSKDMSMPEACKELIRHANGSFNRSINKKANSHAGGVIMRRSRTGRYCRLDWRMP